MNTELTELTKKIEERRKELRISTSELCRRVEIDRVTYWRHINKGKDFNIGLALKLLKALDLKVLIYA